MTRPCTAMCVALLAWTPILAQRADSSRADSSRTDTLAPGVTHTRLVRPLGPWVIHIVRVDLRRADLAVRHVRAHDQLTSRERVSAMVARRAGDGEQVLAAVNADFFDLQTGANENNVLIDGEWWKGIRVTDSPFDTFDNVHAQFALDSARHPRIDRFTFDGWLETARLHFPLITLNAPSAGAHEGAALFTPRFGAATPRDTVRPVAELTLTPAGRRGDTLLFVTRGAASRASGSAIPADGAVLAAYGARASEAAAIGERDTLRITLGLTPWPAAGAAAPALVMGGWPRILRNGANVAARAPAEEGTISRNAEVRHPRTAVGFTRDGSTLLLVTVDGRTATSVGMTLVELANLMKALGAWQALNFDGGGSTTMVIGGRVVNSPSDKTGERDVGNALLVTRRAKPAPVSR